MNKNAIQKFAIWARNELIAQVSQRAYQYGIDESGFGDASADTLNAVSYTHLDVYKRQVIPCEGQANLLSSIQTGSEFLLSA